MATRWQVYPKYQPPSQLVQEIVAVFEAAQPIIGTKLNQRPQKKSNQVLAAVATGLRAIGFEVEDQPGGASEEKKRKIKVPVLFGEDGKALKTFEVDGWREEDRSIIEVEAGTAIDARKIYQDLFEALVIPGSTFLCIAVMDFHNPGEKRRFRDFDQAKNVLDTLNESAVTLPFSTILLIGY